MTERSNARTKILCTLGTATSDYDTIVKLVRAGADGFRLNFSHGNKEFFDNMFEVLDKVRTDTDTYLSLLIDLQGPKIRIGELETPTLQINTGETITITNEPVLGTKDLIQCSYQYLPKDASPGDRILIDDGLIQLRVESIEGSQVVCRIEAGGILKPRKGMNLPGMNITAPSITEKDYEQLRQHLHRKIDFIALSFVRSAKDIIALKDFLKENNRDIRVIAKIEKKEALEDLEDIIMASDGIMIARGDLGVELEPQFVPIAQKQIIKRCNALGKLVITATQMLESMISNPMPTRAEASDVANAVLDGTDVVMLSGETAVGKYPALTVETMNKIIMFAESANLKAPITETVYPQIFEKKLFDSINKTVVDLGRQISAAAIIVFTKRGRTALSVAKFRPTSKVIAISDSDDTLRYLNLYRSVYPIKNLQVIDQLSTDHSVLETIKPHILETGYVNPGDLVIFTMGAPISEKARTSFLSIDVL